jgi:hypothetical protein
LQLIIAYSFTKEAAFLGYNWEQLNIENQGASTPGWVGAEILQGEAGNV